MNQSSNKDFSRNSHSIGRCLKDSANVGCVEKNVWSLNLGECIPKSGPCYTNWEISNKLLDLNITLKTAHFASTFTYLFPHHCLLGVRESTQCVNNWVMRCWHGYLEWRANDLHIVQVMSLPAYASWFINIQHTLTFSCWLPAWMGKRQFKRVFHIILLPFC